jgi:antitoxin component YwqK of YwqJK toxin-antitoxin module
VLDEQVLRVPDRELDFDSELVYRWNGRLFTGIGFEHEPDGSVSEISYVDGWQHGVSRDWYPSGALRSESAFYANCLHGWSREYDESGSVRAETLYEYGIATVSARQAAASRA